jgi:hypothetical protein
MLHNVQLSVTKLMYYETRLLTSPLRYRAITQLRNTYRALTDAALEYYASDANTAVYVDALNVRF